MLTVCLVVLVIFFVPANLSATVIPSLALPMSIVGTFAAMYLLDYSLDNLSLMALTLSVGFVVDDAIVMPETSCGTSKRASTMEAALKARAKSVSPSSHDTLARACSFRYCS